MAALSLQEKFSIRATDYPALLLLGLLEVSIAEAPPTVPAGIVLGATRHYPQGVDVTQAHEVGLFLFLFFFLATGCAN